MREKAQHGFMRVMAAVLSAAMTVGVTAGTLGIIEANVTSASAAETKEYTSNDFKYTVLDDGTAEITGYTGNDSELVIPSEIDGRKVTVIGNSAFEDCTGLTNVNIPDSVTTIGDYAFSDCSSLASVTIPDGIKNIGRYAFRFSGLKSVTIPGSATNIDYGIFNSCKNLTSVIISDGVKTITEDMFRSCKKLTDITIPSSVTTIEKYAFYWCVGLTSINIPNSVEVIENNVFEGCSGLTSVFIPESVKSIESKVFDNCQSLNNINVSERNRYYSSQDGVLFNKSKTALLQYPNGKPHKSYIIPEYVTTIGDSAFAHCENLTSITIPNSVTTIEHFAFKLSGLMDITIPDSVTTLESYAFFGCLSLTNVSISDNMAEIEKGTFYGCSALKNITIPNNVTKIGDYAFEDCKNLTICGNQGSYAETYATENNIPFKANLENKSAISATTITNGTEITLTGKAVGGTGSYQYAMLAKYNGKWTVLKNYDTTATKTWTPSKAGTYKVAIKVKDSSGKVLEKLFTVTVKSALTNNSAISDASITKGTEITLTGKASGGTAPYKFQMVAKHENDTKWTVLKDYNTTSTKKWTPAKTGTYKVAIKVKDSSGKVVEKIFTITVNPAALANASTVSATSITKGTEITLTGKASGGTAPYKFQMVAKHENDTKWTVLKDYSTTSTKKWTPAKTGTYKVAIKVKDSSGKVVEKLFAVTVK